MLRQIDLYDFLKETLPTIRCDERNVFFEMGYTGKKTENILSINDIMKKYGITKHAAEFARKKVLGIEDKKYPGVKNKHSEIISDIKQNGVVLNNKLVKCNRYISVDEDFMYVMGWYMAEGSSPNQSCVEIDVNSIELPIVERIKSIFREKFNLDSEISHKKTSKCCRVICSSSILSTFMTELCGKYSHFKKVKPFILDSILEDPKWFLHGLFEGDGHNCVHGLSNSLTTVSRDLAYQVYNILRIFDFNPSIKYQNTKDTDRWHYKISLFSSDFERFNKFIEVAINKDRRRVKTMNSIVVDEQQFVRILDVKNIGVMDGLLDIEVEGTHNFVANGIVVHNCVMTSLSCGTPVIVTKTGGMQDQASDGETTFGFMIEPAARSIIGSQDVPYIYEDRVSKEDFLDCLTKMYNMPKEERKRLGLLGREHVIKNFELKRYVRQWDEILTKTYETRGSWKTRKNYNRFSLVEI